MLVNPMTTFRPGGQAMQPLAMQGTFGDVSFPHIDEVDVARMAPVNVVIQPYDVWKVVYAITAPQEEGCTDDPE